MSRNGPLALAFHALFVSFILAPILIVCAVAFTPEGFLSLPTRGLSLRWFRAILDYPEFIRAFQDSVWLAALSSTVSIGLAVPAALGSSATVSWPRGHDDAFHVAPHGSPRRARDRLPALLLAARVERDLHSASCSATSSLSCLSRCASCWRRPTAWTSASSTRRCRSAPTPQPSSGG